jgi:hypothetical protein
MGIMASIGFCDHIRSLGSTAGCGKPHVRWCGRGDGRNPVTSSRSELASVIDTARLRQLNPWDFIAQALAERRKNQPAPRLPVPVLV